MWWDRNIRFGPKTAQFLGRTATVRCCCYVACCLLGPMKTRFARKRRGENAERAAVPAMTGGAGMAGGCPMNGMGSSNHKRPRNGNGVQERHWVVQVRRLLFLRFSSHSKAVLVYASEASPLHYISPANSNSCCGGWGVADNFCR